MYRIFLTFYCNIEGLNHTSDFRFVCNANAVDMVVNSVVKFTGYFLMHLLLCFIYDCKCVDRASGQQWHRSISQQSVDILLVHQRLW